MHAVVHCNESRWPRLSAGAAATTVFKTENVFPTTLCSKRSSLMSILLIWFPLTRFFSLSSACSCTLQQVSVAKTVCYSSSYFIIQNPKLKTTHVVKPLLNTRKPACQIALLYISWFLNSDFEHCSQTKYSTPNSTAASNERSLKSKYTVQNGMMDIACVVADNIYS